MERRGEERRRAEWTKEEGKGKKLELYCSYLLLSFMLILKWK